MALWCQNAAALDAGGKDIWVAVGTRGDALDHVAGEHVGEDGMWTVVELGRLPAQMWVSRPREKCENGGIGSRRMHTIVNMLLWEACCSIS